MLATANTGKIRKDFGKNAGKWTGRVEISKEEIPGFKGRTFKLCVLARWDFNLCVRSSPLRGHKSCFLSQFIFHGHSTQEPAFSRVAYFILWAYTGTSVSNSQHGKKSGEVLEKMQVNGPDGKK